MTTLNSNVMAAMSDWLDLLVEKKALPCAVTQVTIDGKTEYRRATGFADIATGEAISEDSIFRLYSMSKPIVSVALMMLYEEGRFQLGDPVYRYLGSKWRKENMSVFAGWRGDEESGRKDVSFDTVPCHTHITMRQVLTHTAGLSYGFDPSGRGIAVDRIYNKMMVHPARHPENIAEDDPSMLGAFCDVLAEMPLLYQPGTQWNYSYATDVCGALVEVLSGQSLDEFLAERVFGPIGMVDAGFDLVANKADRMPHNYRYVPPEGIDPSDVYKAADTLYFPHLGTITDVDEGSRGGYLNLSRPKFLSGGGGLVGTASDYSKFCTMLLSGGVNDRGERVMGSRTIDYMTSNHLPRGQGLMDMVPNPEFQYSETAKNGGAFGLGFSIVQSTQEAGLIGSIGNYAWGGAAATIFWCDPVERISVVFCTQVMGMQPPNMLRAKLGNFIYGALE